MDAYDIIAAVADANGQFRVVQGRLQIRVPAGCLPDALKVAIREQESAIADVLNRAQTVSSEEAYRLNWTWDPRRDDRWPDTHQWTWLLTRLFDERGGPPDQLFGGVQYLRCLGAQLQCRGDGHHLLLGECSEAEYEALRRELLLPNGVILKRLLQELPSRECFLPAAQQKTEPPRRLLCRYADHRTFFLNNAGQRICATCHPPRPGLEVLDDGGKSMPGLLARVT